MKPTRFWPFRGMVLLFVGCVFRWQAQVHPPEPSVNLGQTTFLDGQGGPGLLVEEIEDGMQSGAVVDSTGRNSANGSGSDSLNDITHIAWESKKKLLGGWYGVELLAAIAHLSEGAKGSVGGFGDVTISPFILQWKELKIGRIQLHQRVDLDLSLPVGQHSRETANSLSSHSFRIEPYYAFTLLCGKHLETRAC